MNNRSTITRPGRRRPAGIVGLLTIAVVALVGYVAYQANTGLPWQSRYDVYVLTPDADRLIKAADVRMGGVRVGAVLDVSSSPGGSGKLPYARIKLALERSVSPLPVDSTVRIRPASVLGLTYVDLHRGVSKKTVRAGSVLRLSRSRSDSDLTDLLDIFDRDSAQSFQDAVTDLGYGLAGRGQAINALIASTSQVLLPLGRVSRTLAAPSTRLESFFAASDALARGLVPARDQLAGLFSGAATTLGVLAKERVALGAAIDAAPSAETSTAVAFRHARPALDGLAKLTRALRPVQSRLSRTLTRANDALAAGRHTMVALPGFARSLGPALKTVEALARDKATSGSLRKLHSLAVSANTILASFVPAQKDCDVLGLFGQNIGATWGANGDGDGPDLPVIAFAGLGAVGEPLQQPKPSVNVAINPLPIENADECESDNEPFSGKQQLNNPPGLQSTRTRDTDPPPGVTELARKAGLLEPIEGAR